MSWLIDTKIISEVRRGPRCHPSVAAWWAGIDDADLFLSVLSLGEIGKGCEAVRLRDASRISEVRTVPVIDTLLGATALVHDLTLVTRNTGDVEGLGARVLNPVVL